MATDTASAALTYAPHRAVQLVEVGTSAAELHPSPADGMAGGWQSIATAPKDGARILLHPAVEVHDAWSKGYWSEQHGCWIVGGSASGVAHTYWLPLPPAPPTTPAGSGKGGDGRENAIQQDNDAQAA